jgi:hypothetical protein
MAGSGALYSLSLPHQRCEDDTDPDDEDVDSGGDADLARDGSTGSWRRMEVSGSLAGRNSTHGVR